MSSPFLCTTALSEFWNYEADKLLFLGQWCLRYDNQNKWKHLNYEVLPYPWDNRDAMHRAALYQEEVYGELLGLLGEFLNHVHDELHRTKYWQIILGPWLLNYIQILHERYICLNIALEKFPTLDTIGLSSSSFKTPRHFLDHIWGSTDDPYNLQLYTILLQTMGHELPVRDFHWIWGQRRLSNPGTKWKFVLKKLRPLWQSFGRLWAKNSDVLMVDIYIPLKQVIQLMLGSHFRARWCALPEPERWVDEVSQRNMHPRRADLANLLLRKDDPFRSALVKTLPFHLPFIYLEGYRYCRKWVKQKWYKSKIRKIMTASGIEVNEPLKFITAELNKKGVKLIIFQHGGSYGSSRYNPLENIERRASDEYWSWGWGKQENGVRPMPNPKLSLLALRRRENSKTDKKYILFVGNAVPRYHYRTYSIPIANQGIQYLEWQISFVKELETHIRSKVVFRPFPIDYGWALRQRLQDTCSDLNRDDSNDYYARLVGASLVVCDMNQTTLLESLGANIPTIAFWNPHFWELRLSAKPYFKLLRDSGILHHTPQEAANAVNCIWPRVEDWWTQSEIQLARQRFVNRYALHSSAWIQKWCKALFLNV